jgi:hypothetical protein
LITYQKKIRTSAKIAIIENTYAMTLKSAFRDSYANTKRNENAMKDLPEKRL